MTQNEYPLKAMVIIVLILIVVGVSAGCTENTPDTFSAEHGGIKGSDETGLEGCNIYYENVTVIEMENIMIAGSMLTRSWIS